MILVASTKRKRPQNKALRWKNPRKERGPGLYPETRCIFVSSHILQAGQGWSQEKLEF